MMEIYGSNCRMILITTKISGIIDPIVSRCQVFLVPQANYQNFKKLMENIANNESLEIDDNVYEYLYRISKGKISKAIDLLQLCSVTGSNINLDKLYSTTKKFESQEIRQFIKKCFSDDFPALRESFREILDKYKYNIHDFFIKFGEEIQKLPLSTYAKSHIMNLIANADFRAIDGRDDDIQVSNLIAEISAFAENL
ncbi:MAG: hypothetical protein EU541_03205 [Promethearchaeota archaeon]|nr:MAG: hypothetical protein EU541_03205 [Candidatus Lokiarchaeota archaeon]